MRRRTNLLLGILGLVIAGVVLAQAIGAIPAPIYDIILRSWSVVLVVIGLAYLLRGRVPLSNFIALVAGVALVGGLTAYAFSARSQQQRDDYVEMIAQPLPDDLALLRVRIATLNTDVELLPSVSGEMAVNGRFIGSSESLVTVEYVEGDDASATLTVGETIPNPIPMLDAVGRGTLQIELPPDVPLDVELVNLQGGVSLNLGGTRLERLNLDLQLGNALVTLPSYAPMFSESGETLGTLAVRQGDITLIVPDAVAARFELERGASGIEPIYDLARYNLLFNGTVLESRTIENADIVVQYAVTAPRGLVRLQLAEGISASADDTP